MIALICIMSAVGAANTIVRLGATAKCAFGKTVRSRACAWSAFTERSCTASTVAAVGSLISMPVAIDRIAATSSGEAMMMSALAPRLIFTIACG